MVKKGKLANDTKEALSSAASAALGSLKFFAEATGEGFKVLSGSGKEIDQAKDKRQLFTFAERKK